MTTTALILLATSTAALARTAYRLLRQRDAERVRGDLLKLRADLGDKRNDQQQREFGRKVTAFARREAMLLDDPDYACAEAVALRERLEAVEARELPQLSEIRARRRSS